MYWGTPMFGHVTALEGFPHRLIYPHTCWGVHPVSSARWTVSSHRARSALAAAPPPVAECLDFALRAPRASPSGPWAPQIPGVASVACLAFRGL